IELDLVGKTANCRQPCTQTPGGGNLVFDSKTWRLNAGTNISRNDLQSLDGPALNRSDSKIPLFGVGKLVGCQFACDERRGFDRFCGQISALAGLAYTLTRGRNRSFIVNWDAFCV